MRTVFIARLVPLHQDGTFGWGGAGAKPLVVIGPFPQLWLDVYGELLSARQRHPDAGWDVRITPLAAAR